MGRGCQESQGRFGALLGALPEPLELLQGPRVSAGFSVPSFRVSIEILRAAEISHLVPSHPCRKGSLSGGAGCCSWGCRDGQPHLSQGC